MENLNEQKNHFKDDIGDCFFRFSVATSGSKAEEILLTCEWSDKDKFDLDINETRILWNGKNSEKDYFDISSRYISWGTGFLAYSINRETGVLTLTTQSGGERGGFHRALCKKVLSAGKL